VIVVVEGLSSDHVWCLAWYCEDVFKARLTVKMMMMANNFVFKEQMTRSGHGDNNKLT